jgi:hypothetical protein
MSRSPGLAILAALTVSLSACGSKASKDEDPKTEAKTKAKTEAKTEAETTKAEAAEAEPKPAPKGPLRVSGFAKPRSVIHDPKADVYLVSNEGGSDDAPGFISRVSPAGEMVEREWCTGEPSITGRLGSPAGMALLGDELVVADRGELRLFAREDCQPTRTISTVRWAALVDVEPDGAGGLFVSDFGGAPDAGGLYHYGEDRFGLAGAPAPSSVSFENPRPGQDFGSRAHIFALEVGGPLHNLTGLARREDRLFMTSAGGALDSLPLQADAKVDELTGAGAGHGQLDGLVALADGQLLVAGTSEGVVYRVTPEGEWGPILEDIGRPTGIGWDGERERLLIPLHESGELLVHPL